jgi:microcompartment protein CcmL/EutN
MDKHVKEEICNGWCDLLSQYTLAEVRAGVAAVFAASSGKLKSINEYQVQAEIKKAHREFLATLPKQEPEPERKQVDPETAAAILAEAGFAPKRMDNT